MLVLVPLGLSVPRRNEFLNGRVGSAATGRACHVPLPTTGTQVTPSGCFPQFHKGTPTSFGNMGATDMPEDGTQPSVVDQWNLWKSLADAKRTLGRGGSGGADCSVRRSLKVFVPNLLIRCDTPKRLGYCLRE